ncbi:MAG: hypothetical protein HC889_12335 [Synechococcaceae cyanobacterium SM1_2_3]|nr:hypothetical protein [Synechococcaceae cyanobacterium SM1_2_3]
MSESVLTKQAIERLSSDFEIKQEVIGHNAFYNKDVRIDLMLRAKPHLVQHGFINEWFGVECKWAEGVNGQTAKTTKAVWQAITYAQSTFNINGAISVPRFVAVLTPNLEPLIEQHISTLLQLSLYGCVARMYFYKDGNWGIKFASIYSRSGPSIGEYYVSKRQLPKYRAGSIA